MTRLNEILNEMSNEIPGLVMISVVGNDGLLLAINSKTKYDYEVINAQFTMVMKLITKTLNQLKQKGFNDFLVTTKNNYLLSRYIGDGSFWLDITVDRNDGSLGNIRLIAEQFSDTIWEAIPKRKR